jgi:hypothetical protein
MTHFYIGKCHEQIRRAGYLDFTLDIRMLHAMPSHIATLGKFSICFTADALN